LLGFGVQQPEHEVAAAGLTNSQQAHFHPSVGAAAEVVVVVELLSDEAPKTNPVNAGVEEEEVEEEVEESVEPKENVGLN
jgi:hypothetical protein